MRLACFDVDGTIVNTRELNIEAYLSVGVVMPPTAWGTRWQNWLPGVVGDLGTAAQLHTQKVKNFTEMLRSCDLWDITLPAAEIARELIETLTVEVQFLTAASLPTARLILQKLMLNAPVADNLPYEAKKAHLEHSLRSADYHTVTYVDDDAINVSRLREQLPELNVIHFENQSYRDLRLQIREAVWDA